MDDKEPVFKSYKEKQAYYKEKIKNLDKTFWVSKQPLPTIGVSKEVARSIIKGRTYVKEEKGR